MIEVSAIVVTHNRKDMLKKCLDSLFNQDYPKNKYDIIVVDNASTDGTSEIVKGLQKAHKSLILVKENRKGICYARNAGIKASKAPIVAFTDDDCIVDKEWLKLIAFYHKKYPKISGIGGKVINGRPDNIVHTANQIFRGAFLPIGSDKIQNTNFIIGCNMSYKKGIFKDFNFDNSIDYGGDETKLNFELIKNNKKLLFIPKLKVIHFHANCNNLVLYLIQIFKCGKATAKLNQEMKVKTQSKGNKRLLNNLNFRLKILIALIQLSGKLGYIYQSFRNKWGLT